MLDGILVATSMVGVLFGGYQYFAPKARAKRQKQINDDLLMDGLSAAPGIAAIQPLGNRLGGLEVDLQQIRSDVATTRGEVATVNGKVDLLSASVKTLISEFATNDGHTMRDAVNRIESQTKEKE